MTILDREGTRKMKNHKIEITEKEYEAYQYQTDMIRSILKNINGLSENAIFLLKSTLTIVEAAEKEANEPHDR